MPPVNASEQTLNRKRAPSERVIPAIPLALSKPKLAKPNKRVESDSKAEAKQDVTIGEGLDVEQKRGGVIDINGESKPYGGINDTQKASFADVAVRMPLNGSFASRPGMSIPIGATSGGSNTPPPTEEPSVAATPPSSRKPTEKFDMRHVRNELPPLAPTFVPAAEQHTPRSATSSHSNRPLSHPYFHGAQASSNSIMFGSQDSLTSSPAPPLSAGPAFAPPQFGNQYGSMGPPQHPYFVPYGHSHHMSEPYSQRMYQPMYSQQSVPWNMRHTYGQPPPQAPYFQPHPHTAFRYPPREMFTPIETQQYNGQTSASRSASQASSAAADQKTARTLQSPMSPADPTDSANVMLPEPKAAFPGHAHPRQPQLNRQMPPPPPMQFPSQEAVSNIESAEHLGTHVFSQFDDPAFADCRVIITEQPDGDQLSFQSHRVIISRSPTLMELIRKSDTKQLPMEIPIQLNGQYLRCDSFTDALKYLYGGPLLQIDHQRPGSSAGGRLPSNVERMEYALRYIATGAWLRVADVAARGVVVAAGLLHWDTISTALAFAVDGGLSQVWNVEDGSEDRASTSSSDDSLGRPEPAVTPTYDPFATHLLQRIIDFMVHVLPPNFYLDSSAPQVESCPRLPPLPPSHESRQSRSDPRLSQIRFGEMSMEDHQRPSFATTTISSVLLSLPFQLLKCVLEHYDLTARLGPETVASIMRQVVAERETRRARVLKARTASKVDDNSDAQLVQNLYWQESVEPSSVHRAGSRLARRKRDIDTPPSSGACSERNK